MKPFLQFFLLFVSLFFHSVVNAIPYQYSFSGTVEFIEADDLNGNYFNSVTLGDFIDFGGSIFTVGETITYEFLVDFHRAGRCSDPSGITGTGCVASGSDIVNVPTSSFEYFYAELLSASNSTPLTWFDATLNYGYSQAGLTPSGKIFGESAIWVEENTKRVQDWLVGDMFSGFDRWETNLAFGQVLSSLTLDDIRPLPVPEPPIFFLLIIALAMWLKSRRFRRSY